MANYNNVKEFDEIPNLEDFVMMVRSNYSEYRNSFPFNKGKVLKKAFNKITNNVYEKFSSFQAFTDTFPSARDFKSDVSKKIQFDINHKKVQEKEISKKEIDPQKLDQFNWKAFLEH